MRAGLATALAVAALLAGGCAEESSTADGCSTDYRGQYLDPALGDYDCEGNEGNGPGYVTGTVTVVGTDVFGLDRDGDGTGCD